MQLLQFREKTSGADAAGGGGRQEQGSRKRLGVGGQGEAAPCFPVSQVLGQGQGSVHVFTRHWEKNQHLMVPEHPAGDFSAFLVGKNNIPSRTTK